ncbi:hypothetical protein ACJJTC_009770 [Scirpophaga incertulas]
MYRVTSFWKNTNRWHRLLFLFLLVELRVIPKRKLGFECNDPKLSHPYTGDTISWKWLLSTVSLLPLIILLLVERVYHKNDMSKKRAIHWYKEYFYGMLINLTLVQTLKIFVGAPRPHFFDSCKPLEASTCTVSEYIFKYTCNNERWVSESDTSFPSGHTSLAIHTGFFIAYYLQRRIKHIAPNTTLGGQVLSVLASVFCSLSRITDRRHHPRDVIGGFVLAVPILIYTIFSLCRNFDCREMEEEQSPTKETEVTENGTLPIAEARD